MNKKLGKFLLIFALLAGLLAAVWYFWLNPSKALNFALPNLNQLSYINATIRSDTAHIAVIGVLENKAPYKLTIDSLRYRLELAGATLISEVDAVNIKQAPGQIDTVDLTFKLPISFTRSMIKELQDQDSTYINAHFELTYNTFLGRTTIPVERKIDIKVPSPPDIKLKKVRMGKLNLKRKSLDLRLEVEVKNNSENIEVHLRDLAYDARIGDNIRGKGVYDEMIAIKPLSTIIVDLPASIEVEKPFQVIGKIITNKDSMDYEINLRGVLDNDSFQDIPIFINAAGSTELVK